MVTKVSVANVKTEFRFGLLLVYALVPLLVPGFWDISLPDLVAFC